MRPLPLLPPFTMRFVPHSLASVALGAAGVALAAPQNDLTTNGDFELGDTSSWQSFPTTTSTFDVTVDAASGGFAGEIVNVDPAAAAVVKQANLGIGTVQPGDEILISFAAKGMGAVGGVAFAEVFSEGSAGVSAAALLGGAPLPLSDQWQSFCFSTTAGPDVANGFTLQFAAITGAAVGSESTLLIDDVSVLVPRLSVNGDFEQGDTSGWEAFPTANGSFTATSDANSGSFGGELLNPDAPAAGVVKQANLGVGLVSPGDTLTVSFAAKGDFGVGGIAFAEFFSEGATGVSMSEFLGGGPIPLTTDWQSFSYTVTAGPDVTNGVTLQFAAVTGAVAGSFANISIDDVTVETTSGTVLPFCATSPNSVGAGATMSFTGSPSVGAQDFVVHADGLPPFQFALLFLGESATSMPAFDGTMCVNDVCRIGPIVQSDAAGHVSRDLTDAVYTQYGCAPPVIGTRYHFQYAYRDVVGARANWSNGLCVTFGL